VGRTVKAARLARDLYHRAVSVMRTASALGGFVSLDDEESFAIEYWPLELYKLSLAPPPRELQGAVALITGAAGGIGGAVARRLEECARTGEERGCVLRREGRVAPPRPLPRRGARGRPDPCEHRQPRRRPRGLAHLGLDVARRARPRLRHPERGARGALPRAD